MAEPRFYVGRPVGRYERVIDREYVYPAVRVFESRRWAYVACEALNRASQRCDCEVKCQPPQNGHL